MQITANNKEVSVTVQCNNGPVSLTLKHEGIPMIPSNEIGEIVTAMIAFLTDTHSATSKALDPLGYIDYERMGQ